MVLPLRTAMLQHRSVQREQRNIRSGIAKEKQGGTHMCTLVTCIVLELDNSILILVVQSFRKEYTRNSKFLCFSEVSSPHARHFGLFANNNITCATTHARKCTETQQIYVF